MLGDSKLDSEKFIRKLSRRTYEYFGGQYQLKDFKLSKVILTADIDVHSRENVSAYLKVLRRIGRVKGFSPVSYDCFDKDASFCLEGNSNGVEFVVYDLEKTLLEQLGTKGNGRKKLGSITEKTKGVLRGEVRLTTSKAILSYTNTAADIFEQIGIVIDKCQDIFFEVFVQIVPFGDFYKKDKVVEIIRDNVDNRVMQRKMLRLVALIPEKKSLWLAQKEMGCRDMETVMREFAKIGVSPVTIGKRSSLKRLGCLYDFLVK